MSKYSDTFDMQLNPTFIKQVTVACRVAAANIINEDPNASNHSNRIIWANQILALNDFSNTIINKILGSVTSNPALQLTAPSGPWVDSDIQFVVNSLIDLQANKL